MCDWYLEYFKKTQPTNTVWPIVLDADDVLMNQDLVCHYATIITKDPTKLKFEWEQSNIDSLNLRESLMSKMHVTINSSTGITKSKAVLGLDMGAKAKERREKFGKDEGDRIEKLVRELCRAMSSCCPGSRLRVQSCVDCR